MNKDVWITTYTGEQFGLFNGRGEIRIKDIAHALSNLCRFNGHCKQFYSVAEHSTLVADIVQALHGTMTDELAGLLHDASEAYLGDWSQPLKSVMPSWLKNRESKLMARIYEKFSILWYDREVVKRADDIALAIEARDLMAHVDGWNPGLISPTITISKLQPLNPQDAEEEFLLYHRYISSLRR